jgi:methylmalonyl-CoA/ethylmalonyl-CoA epimerase
MTDARPPLAKRIDHVGVAVRDIEKALPFYVDVLGMTVSVDVRLADGSARLAYLEAGDTTLQLVQPLVPGSVADFLASSGEGLHHICFAVDDLVAALGSLPGDQPMDGIYVGGRQCRVSFTSGRPSGVVVELTEQMPVRGLDASGEPVTVKPSVLPATRGSASLG